jgi:hypothetical protein
MIKLMFTTKANCISTDQDDKTDVYHKNKLYFSKDISGVK